MAIFAKPAKSLYGHLTNGVLYLRMCLRGRKKCPILEKQWRLAVCLPVRGM